MTPQQIVSAAVPGASDEFCDYVLWERTPFPAGVVTAQSIYKAASRSARAHKNNRRLCDFCDNEVIAGAYLCHGCRTALSSNAEVRGEPLAASPSRLPC